MNLFEITYDLVRQIPPGKVSTYGTVAKALGDRVAARAVGWMMNQNRKKMSNAGNKMDNCCLRRHIA